MLCIAFEANYLAMPYIGRFAPSPTGPLHFGSLFAAVASYLDARAHDGQWLLRIDDLDAPRCEPGADTDIIQAMAAHGLQPDGKIVWQQPNQAAYQAALQTLRDADLLYGCTCTRKGAASKAAELGLPHGVYPGTCRDAHIAEHDARALRLRLPGGVLAFDDRFCGPQQHDSQGAVGDPIVLRADGLIAYPLAVVVDDHAAGVTDIVRGADLLETTPAQIAVYNALGCPVPRYAHVPVQHDAAGNKLSKQHGAPAIDANKALANLQKVFAGLQLGAISGDSPEQLLECATDAWRARLK